METDFLTKCKILSEVWIDENDNPSFNEFIRFHDLGLPLAYCHINKYATLSDSGKAHIETTWNALLDLADVVDDEGFETLEDMFGEGY